MSETPDAPTEDHGALANGMCRCGKSWDKCPVALDEVKAHLDAPRPGEPTPLLVRKSKDDQIEYWRDQYLAAESRATAAELKLEDYKRDAEADCASMNALDDRIAAAESRATTAEQNDALSMAMRTYLENKLARAESHLSTTRSALERIAAGTGRSTWVDIARAALKEME